MSPASTVDTTRQYRGSNKAHDHQAYISQRPSRPSALQHYFSTCIVFTISLAVLLCRSQVEASSNSGDAMARQSEKWDGMKQEFPERAVYLQRWSSANTYPRPGVASPANIDNGMRMQSPSVGGDYDMADADSVPAWPRERRSYQQQKPVVTAGLLSNRFPAGWDKRAQTFVRFGKRAQTFVRFGKRAQTFVRFG